jgi:hypothetical protein
MGKYITIDDTFCYLNYEKEGVVYALKIKPIEQKLREKIQDERILFKDYLHSSPPWHEDFNQYEKEYRQHYEKEIETLNFILTIYPNETKQIIIKREISPSCLINFLSCFCWLNGNYESECLAISSKDFDYAIYESSNNFLFGRKRGSRVVAFRYSEFKSITLSQTDSHSFRIEDKYRGFNGRLDKRWNSLHLG